jgi:NADPH-dependent 2,4-dienoyl-CoA reductase/sulfur reductase-like enzyme/rhodanese-related sulfurtransferase
MDANIMNTTTNQPLRIVIIGGVAGGATAAARARRTNAQAEITLLEKGPVVSFANCGLPYHIGGDIAQRDSLLVTTPELFHKRFRIEVRTQTEALHINRDQQSVEVIHHPTGEKRSIHYDRLILATGSEPLRPSFYPQQSTNVFQLWTLADMDRILDYMRSNPVKHVTVVGAGFVGLETVEQFHRLGLKVTLLEKAPQVLSPLDSEMAALIHNELVHHNVDVIVNADVRELRMNQQQATAIVLADGTEISTDLVLVGAGVRPRVELAKDAGLQLGATGGVTVNQFMQTNDPLIYAVGDMAEYHHGVTDEPSRVPLAGPANRSGRVAGAHAASGKSTEMGSVLGTSVVRVFQLTAACTGLSQRACGINKIAHRTVIIQAAHHASYFPGAKNLTLKLIYSPADGKILGASCVGAEGADKRIDVIATAMHFGSTVDDLAQVDLAYAPPYGSAKDPVHMAAFAASNDLQQWPSLNEPNSDLSGFQVVDVRTVKEQQTLPLPGAIAISVDELSTRWTELDPTRPTICVCHSGKRAHVAACLLKGQGFSDVRNLSGGMSIRRLMVKDQ